MVKDNEGRVLYKVEDGTVLFYGDDDGIIRRNIDDTEFE